MGEDSQGQSQASLANSRGRNLPGQATQGLQKGAKDLKPEHGGRPGNAHRQGAPKALLARNNGQHGDHMPVPARRQADVNRSPIGHGRQVRGHRGDYWYGCISDFELFELSEQPCRTGQIKVVANGPVSSRKLQVRKPCFVCRVHVQLENTPS